MIAALISGDAERFYEEETRVREMAGLPPFGRLASIVVSAATRKEAEDHARALKSAAGEDEAIEVLGPAEAPLAVLRGRHRFRLLFQGSRRSPMQAFLRAVIAAAPKPRGTVEVQIDIDPQSFL